MSNEVRKAGQYELTSFRISKITGGGESIDLKFMIHKWNLVESMETGYLHGSAAVFDSVGVFYDGLDGTGIKAEEELEVTYIDWFGEELTHKLYVYAVTNVEMQEPANETILTYTLHFVSKEKLLSENKTIRKALTGEIGDQAQTIFTEYFQSDNIITVTPTFGQQNLVVPNYTPEQTMHFLARKAYSGDTKSSDTYRFFQNRNQYYFTTHDDLAFQQLTNEINLYINVNEADQSPEGQRLLMQNIIGITFPPISSTIDDINEGAYHRSVTELDILNRRVVQTKYQYLDEYGNYFLPDSVSSGQTKNIHSKAFVDEYLNDIHDTLVIKDYASTGDPAGTINSRPQTYYSQTYNKKSPSFQHHMNNAAELTVYGKNDVYAGMYIQLELTKATADMGSREKDSERSGTYLIESINNVFRENDYIQVMTISKSGIKGNPESASNYDREPREIGTV